MHDHTAAEIEHQQQADIADQTCEGKKGAMNRRQLEVVAHIGFAESVEPLRLAVFLVVGFDQADRVKGRADEFGHSGKLLLHGFKPAMQAGGQKTGEKGQKRHGGNGHQGQSIVDNGHEGKRRQPHEQGVDRRHQPHAGSHLYRGKIIGGQSHYRSGGLLLEEGFIQCQDVGHHAVAQVHFEQAGKPQQQLPPDIAQGGNQQGNEQDVSPTGEQPG